MHPTLGGQQPVGETALDDEGGRQQAGLLPLGRLFYFHGEPPALGPALVHAQHHLGPVLGVGPPGTGMDLADGIAVVVLPREERLQLEPTDPPSELGDRQLQLLGQPFVGRSGRLRLVHQLEQDRGVAQVALKALEPVDVVDQSAQLRGDRTGPIGVVPQVRARRIGLELGPARAELVHPQVPLRLPQPGMELVKLGREVAVLCVIRRLRRRHGRACTSCRSRTSKDRCDRPSPWAP